MSPLKLTEIMHRKILYQLPYLSLLKLAEIQYKDAVPVPAHGPMPTKIIRFPAAEDPVPAPVPEPTKIIRVPAAEDPVPAIVPEPT